MPNMHERQSKSDGSDLVAYPTTLPPSKSEIMLSLETQKETQPLDPDPEPSADPEQHNAGSEKQEPEPPELRCSSQSRRPPSRYGDLRTHLTEQLLSLICVNLRGRNCKF